MRESRSRISLRSSGLRESSVQRAAAARAEALHEAIADERRVAHGLRDARLVVDLRRQQGRPPVGEGAVEVPNPLVCIMTQPRWPAIQELAAMPIASSSRVVPTDMK